MKIKLPADPPGLIALVLALGLAIGFAGALLLAAGARTPPLTDNTSTLLSTIGGGMVGSVGTYLGLAARRRHRDEDDPDDEDAPGSS